MALPFTGEPRSNSRETRESRNNAFKLVPSQLEENAEMAVLLRKIGQLEAREIELTLHLEDMRKAFALRAAPVEGERTSVIQEKVKLRAELARYEKMPQNAYPPAPGPLEFEFVDSRWFGALGNAVVVFNLSCMAFANNLHSYHSLLCVLDNMCLLWYVFELAAKWHYHREDLFCGQLYLVWWNWLDAGIVVCGVVDQWAIVLLRRIVPFEMPIDLRMLRMLRLFRLMRFLRVVKAFVWGDLSWIEGAPLQFFMSAIIVVNSAVISLELDTDWAGWFWCEQVFLLLYSFELLVRLKYAGLHFFVNSERLWNNLDFVMVFGGVISMWLMPLASFIQAEVSGERQRRNDSLSSVEELLKVLRICRVLRLVRIIKVVKPLYELLVSVMDAMGAMQWVMLLTLLVLYAGAVVFTSLIGHGYIYSSKADMPLEAESLFGSVSRSLFSLFRLMNSDTSVVAPFSKDRVAELLFVIFMVLCNWALLAIMTSVVSEKLISTSRRLEEEDKKRDEQDQLEFRERRLRRFLCQLDADSDGSVTRYEWDVMLDDEELRLEFGHLSGLDKGTMRDIFSCLSLEGAGIGEYIRIEDFIAHLNHDKDVADRRQMMHLAHLMKKLEEITLDRIVKLEDRTGDRFEELEDGLQKVMNVVAPGPIPIKTKRKL